LVCIFFGTLLALYKNVKQFKFREWRTMAKKTIMLVCSAGMSTSLLVTKMQKAAEERGMDADIFAVSASDADNNLEAKNVNVLLLGPQVRFMKSQFEQKLAPKGIPLDVINMSDYGMMNGEKVLDQAISLMDNK
jgi:PTS system cellobiose-specific IIB component